MGRSWQLGSAFGIGIYVHWSFLLLPTWVFLSNLATGSLPMALYLVLLTLGIFGCIVLHELGHALAARGFDIPTRDITLYPIGGVARLERMTERPWEELWVALAGPAVNVAIAATLGLLLFVSRANVLGADTLEFRGLGTFLLHLAVANVFVAAFNLLPAFPMDGGRVLRALLSFGLGNLRATELAAALGLGMALLFAGLAVLNGTPGLLLLSLFIFLVGRRELALVRQREARRRAGGPLLDVLPVEDEAEEAAGRPDAPLYTGFTWDARTRLWVEWRNGRPVHMIAIEPD